MAFEFDSEKDEVNRAQRGLPLALGRMVIENPIAEFEDDRRDYGERRMVAFGLVEGRLFVCVYTMRGETRRIISLRKANKREQRTWQR